MAKFIVWPEAYNEEPQHFLDFPGLHGKGTKVSVSETGFSAETLEEMIKSRGYPLEIVEDTPTYASPKPRKAEVEVQDDDKTKGGDE